MSLPEDPKSRPKAAPAVKVPADLLDADLLYQRGAVLHEGMASSRELPKGSRRVLHALLTAPESSVVAAGREAGTDALSAAVASLVVHRAVADEEPALIVVVGEDGAPACGGAAGSPDAVDGAVFGPWAQGEDAASAEAALVARAARYLDRDPQALDLRGARMGLRGRLDRINSARMILLNVVASGGESSAVGLQVDRLAQLCGLGEDFEERLLVASSSLGRADRALDAVRTHEFWLAVHVCECLWLEEALRQGGSRGPAPCLVERVRPEDLAQAAQASLGGGPIDLLGVTGAESLGEAAVAPLVARARSVLVTGDAARAEGGSALAAGLAACQWDFSAGGVVR